MVSDSANDKLRSVECESNKPTTISSHDAKEDCTNKEKEADEVKKRKIMFGFPSIAPIHFDIKKMVQPPSFNIGIKPTRNISKKTKR